MEDIDRANFSKQVESELAWFIEAYIPQRKQYIFRLLETCRDRILGDNEVSTLVLSTVGSSTLKGFAVINECRVTKVEMQVQLPGIRINPMTSTTGTVNTGVSLNPNGSFELKQISSSAMYVEMALSCLCRISDPPADCNFTCHDVPQHSTFGVAAVLKEVMCWIQKARRILENEDGACPMEFPGAMLGMPGEWIVSFGVQHAKLITHITSTNRPDSHQATSSSVLSQIPASSHHHSMLATTSAKSTTTAAAATASSSGNPQFHSQPAAYRRGHEPSLSTGSATGRAAAAIVPHNLVKISSDFPSLMSGYDLLMRCFCDLTDLHNQLRALASLRPPMNP